MPEAPGMSSQAGGGNGSRGRSPYVGLSFYREEDCDFFFGRDDERQVIMGNLQASRLTLLYAESGVGKSSLLRAGVAAHLGELARQQILAGQSADVPVVFSAWKDDPVDDLIRQIERTVNRYVPDGDEVELPRDSLADAIAAAVQALDSAAVGRMRRRYDDEDEDYGPRSALLIILDQFEEYFLYGSRESREGRLADELSEAVNRPDLNANFLISIREDAYSALGDLLRGRMRNVYGNYLHLEYLDNQSAREAVVHPIQRYNELFPDEAGVAIEPGLVDALLAEVRRPEEGEQHATDRRGTGERAGDGRASEGQPARPARGHDGKIVTPYLQLVMATLWDREIAEGSHVLRLSTLEELHGARQIVANHLEAALSSLDPAERDLAIDSLDHLVTPSGTKIALEVRDLAEWAGRPVEQVAEVLSKLTGDARILRAVPAAPGKSREDPANQRFEIYHDVLASPIRDSVHERTLRLERRRVARFRKIAAGAVALALLALLGLVAALLAQEAEVSAKHDAQSRQIAASAEGLLASNPERASLLALRAIRLSPTGLAQAALRAALPQLQLQRTLNPSAPAVSASFSPEGKLIVTGTADGVAELWDAASHSQVASLGAPGLSALTLVAFSPDGKLIVTGYGGGTARLWDTSSHEQVGGVINSSSGGSLLSAAFSPDGRQLLIGGNDGTARVWDIRSRKQIGSEIDEPNSDPITGVAFSPDGTQIATSSTDGQAYLWSSAAEHQQINARPLVSASGKRMNSVSFSPTGKMLVTASGGGVADVWDTTTPQRPRRLQTLGSAGPSIIQDASFSPSGKLIVTAELDGKVKIWPVPPAEGAPPSSTPLRVLPVGSNATVLSAEFDRSGARVVTAGADGASRIFDARAGKQDAVLTGYGADVVNSTAFSPDGQSLATGTRDGVLSAWSASDGAPYFHLQLPDGAGVNSVAFSSRGRYLAAAGDNGNAYVVDPRSGSLADEIPATTYYQASLSSAQFDPANENWLMTAAQSDPNPNDSTIRFWNVRSGKSISRELKVSGAQITDARFSPDGSHFVTADTNGNTYIWDTRTHARVGSISEPTTPHADTTLNSAAFSHDGKLVVTTSEDGTARIWSVGNPSRPALRETIHEPHDDALLSAEFGVGDTSLVTSSRDGAMYVWDLASSRQLLALLGHDGSVHKVAVSGDGTRVASASNDGTAKLWSLLPVEQQGFAISEPGRADLTTASFSPDGRLVATASRDGSTRIWGSATPHPLLGVLREPGRHPMVTSAEFSPDGNFIVTADGNGTAVVWNAHDYAKLASLPDRGSGGLSSAEFSPNRNTIVTATLDGGARLWKASTAGRYVELKRPDFDANAGGLRWAAFSPDGRLVVTAEQAGTAKVWDVSTGEQRLATLTEPGGEAMSDAWFSPDDLHVNGRRYPKDDVVVTSSDDGTARIWNLVTGAQLRAVVEPGRSSIFNAVLSPDASKVLTASQDGTAQLWSVRTGELLTTFYVGNSISDAEFSPSGDSVVTAGSYGLARVFSTNLAGPIQTLVTYANQHLTRSLTRSELRTYASGS